MPICWRVHVWGCACVQFPIRKNARTPWWHRPPQSFMFHLWHDYTPEHVHTMHKHTLQRAWLLLLTTCQGLQSQKAAWVVWHHHISRVPAGNLGTKSSSSVTAIPGEWQQVTQKRRGEIGGKAADPKVSMNLKKIYIFGAVVTGMGGCLTHIYAYKELRELLR